MPNSSLNPYQPKAAKYGAPVRSSSVQRESYKGLKTSKLSGRPFFKKRWAFGLAEVAKLEPNNILKDGFIVRSQHRAHGFSAKLAGDARYPVLPRFVGAKPIVSVSIFTLPAYRLPVRRPFSQYRHESW